MNINDNQWKTREGKLIPLDQMEPEHLLNAFVSICSREHQNFVAANKLLAKNDDLQALKDKLIVEAANRGVNLVYPDQRYPSDKWGRYFEAERRTRATEPVVIAPPARKRVAVGGDEEME